jgi:hypothetical protein
MAQSTNIKLFEDKNIRTLWDEDQEQWYFSVVDVIAVLTDSTNPRHYWNVLKGRLKEEGNQSVTNCDQLKTITQDRQTGSNWPQCEKPEENNKITAILSNTLLL